MEISAREATKLTGVDPTMLQNVIDRGYYAAPAAGKGYVRYFGADDLVALTIFRQMVNFKIIPSFAALVASEVRKTMRDNPPIEILWLVKNFDAKGRPLPILIDHEPANPEDVIFRFRVAVYRKQAAADIAQINAAKGAR